MRRKSTFQEESEMSSIRDTEEEEDESSEEEEEESDEETEDESDEETWELFLFLNIFLLGLKGRGEKRVGWNIEFDAL